MRTYYIPTSTRNFNNILASESISPRAFYGARGFGSKHWIAINENDADNVVLLYADPHEFVRPTSEIEDHPMLIAIQTDREFPRLRDGVYYWQATIYLHPGRTEFIFFSEEDKRRTLSLSEGSRETKMVGLYRTSVSRFDGRYLSLTPEETERLSSLLIKEQEVERDRRIDKVKGLLYGYYLGAYLSSEADGVGRLSKWREIGCIFSSILSSGDLEPSPQQLERLVDLLYQVERLEENQAEMFDGISSVLGEHFKELYVEVVNIISRYSLKGVASGRSNYDGAQNSKEIKNGIYKDIFKPSLEGLCQKMLQPQTIEPLIRAGIMDWICQSLDELRQLRETQDRKQGKSKNNKLSSWLDSKIKEAQKNVERTRKRLAPEVEEIIVNDLCVTEAWAIARGPNEEKLYLAWINDVLINPRYNGKISTIKRDLADDITHKAKGILRSQWENSQVKDYLNALRKHIEGEAFDQSWSNGLLPSIGAVLVRGDEWDKLLEYMQDKGMTDYRIAFSLYGMLNGFSSLTRDFTDFILGEGVDRGYVGGFLQEVYGQLLGDDALQSQSPLDEAPAPTSEEHTEQENMNKEEIVKRLDITLAKADPEVIEILRLTIADPKVLEIIELVGADVGRLRESLGKIEPKEARDRPQAKARQYEVAELPLTQDTAPSTSMLSDPSWIEETAKLITGRGSKVAKERYKQDAEDFLAKEGKGLEGKSDEDVINRFEKWLEHQSKKNENEVAYKKIDIPKIIESLRKNV